MEDSKVKLETYDGKMQLELHTGSLIATCKIDTTVRHKIDVMKHTQHLYYDILADDQTVRIPYNMGNGIYTITLCQNVSNDRYKPLGTLTVDIKLKSPLSPFLEPNQYVNYNGGLSEQISQTLSNSNDLIKATQNYIVKHIRYDYIEAVTVKSGYLPDINEVLQTKKGICFDIAALFAALLRYNKIPAKLVIGYADKQYHAWNEVWVDNKWDRFDLTAEITRQKVTAYQTQRVY